MTTILAILSIPLIVVAHCDLLHTMKDMHSMVGRSRQATKGYKGVETLSEHNMCLALVCTVSHSNRYCSDPWLNVVTLFTSWLQKQWAGWRLLKWKCNHQHTQGPAMPEFTCANGVAEEQRHRILRCSASLHGSKTQGMSMYRQ